MAQGFKLTQRRRATLQRVMRQRRATLREMAQLLGYRRTNWSVVHHALDPTHTFQRRTIVGLEQAIDELEEQLEVAS
jgi:hypothetical protein